MSTATVDSATESKEGNGFLVIGPQAWRIDSSKKWKPISRSLLYLLSREANSTYFQTYGPNKDCLWFASCFRIRTIVYSRIRMNEVIKSTDESTMLETQTDVIIERSNMPSTHLSVMTPDHQRWWLWGKFDEAG